MSGVSCILLGCTGANSINEYGALTAVSDVVSGGSYAGIRFDGDGTFRRIQGATTDSYLPAGKWLDGTAPAPEFSVKFDRMSGATWSGNVSPGTWYPMVDGQILLMYIGNAGPTGNFSSTTEIRATWTYTSDTSQPLYVASIFLTASRSNL